MPTVEKDAGMLKLSVEGLRSNSLHPITNIYIVAPVDALQIKAIARELECKFVDESSILGLKKEDIKYVSKGENRGGWLYKMLLNLAADKVCTEENILILDADTVFIRPQLFLYSQKPLFNLSSWYHEPYFEANHRILRLSHKTPLSFITHYMLFNAKILQQLRVSLLNETGEDWHSVILEKINYSEHSAFADYEIYGDFFIKKSKLKPILNYYSNMSLQINERPNLDKLIKAYRGRYSSISLHNYERG